MSIICRRARRHGNANGMMVGWALSKYACVSSRTALYGARPGSAMGVHTTLIGMNIDIVIHLQVNV